MHYSVKDLQATPFSTLNSNATVTHEHQQSVSGKLQQHPEALPEFTIEHVTEYLIYRKEEDKLQAEDWKNFKSGGYKLFKEGHVRNIYVNCDADSCKVTCECLPEMKKDRVYKIKLIIAVSSSNVILAECGCPAGMGPYGSCKHVAATLYVLEDFHCLYNILKVDDNESCTSRLQTWNHPRKKRLDSEKSSAILFHCEEYGEVAKCHHIPFKDPQSEALQITTDKEIKSLVDNLKQCTTSCGLLDLLTKSDSARAKLPPTPRSIQWKVRNEIIKSPLPPNIDTIQSFGKTFMQGITPSSAEQKAIEEVTHRQAASKRWAEERHCRLTASNFGRVLMRRSNHSKLAHDILFTKPLINVPSIQWGRQHEEDAFVKYCSLLDTSITARKAGFVVGDPSYLGASPDGIVQTRDGTSVKLIEHSV